MKTLSRVVVAAGVAALLASCTDSPSGPPTAPAATPADGRGGHAPPPAFTSIVMSGATYTLPLDINLSGAIVGRYKNADGSNHGFLRSRSGSLSSIDVPGAVFTVAAGINRQGDIVGMYSPAESPDDRHGYLLHNGTFTTIDPPGSVFTNALGINGSGDIVGRYCTGDCDAFAGFLYRHGKFTTIAFPGAAETNAWKINAEGEVVGSYTKNDGLQGLFVWLNGHYKAMPLPNGKSVAADNGGINFWGDLVGLFCDEDVECAIGPDGTHGFLLTHEGLTTIDYPGATSTSAIGINLQRDIVGGYFDVDGQLKGYLRTSGSGIVARSDQE